MLYIKELIINDKDRLELIFEIFLNYKTIMFFNF